MTEAAKSLVTYFELLHAGFVKKPGDANLVFCSCVLDAKTKPWEKTEEGLLIKMNKQITKSDQKTWLYLTLQKLVKYLHHNEQN